MLSLRAPTARPVVSLTRSLSTSRPCFASKGGEIVSILDAKLKGKSRGRKKILQELHGKVELKEYDTVVSESKKRFSDRYSAPSEVWIKKMARYLEKQGIKVEEPLKDSIRTLFKSKEMTIRPTDVFKPLDIGDAVELSTALDQAALAVVVEVPSSDDDPRYTIMNKLGELSYLEKSSIKFRIPRLLPKEWFYGVVHKIEDPEADYGSIKTTLDGFERYAVNSVATQIINRPLVDITNKSWFKLQENSRKLELLHRVLQTDGPREISLFTLLRAIKFLDLQETKMLFSKNDNIEHSYKELADKLVEGLGREFLPKYGEDILGKEFDAIGETESFDVELFYSVALAIRKQSRLWATTYSSRSSMVPLSITVLPIAHATKIEDVLTRLKQDPKLVTKFQKRSKSGNFKEVMRTMEPILFLLREYAVGNVTDAKAETLVCQLMKASTKQDINKAIVYDFLTKTGYVKKMMTNPLHLSVSLCLPDSGISNKATLEQKYLDLVDVTAERKSDLAKSRTDYSKLRVFCIDSSTAHEIDDGVSIQQIDQDNYKLFIHVADPASYMTKDSVLTKIAYERASTIYQPEMVSTMLPKTLSDLAGLGIEGKPTRALTFSVPYNISTNKVKIDEAKVETTILSRFPKYTYDDVDAVLTEFGKDAGSNKNEEHTDLMNLFQVAKGLREGRIQNHAVLFGEPLNAQVRVSLNPTLDNDDIDPENAMDVIIEKQKETDSVLLVSELMILGNSIAANILSKNGLNGIYKGMEKMTLSDKSETIVERLNRKLIETSELPTISEIVRSFGFISPAYYSSTPKRHLMLGIDAYAPSTSPLRRFGDLINHFNIHQFLNEEAPMFSKEEALSIALHLEAKNDILKKAARQSNSFYAISELEKEGLKHSGGFIVSSRAFNGAVFGFLKNYGSMARMNLLKDKRPPAIGDILTDYEIIEIDKVGGTVYLSELKS